MCHASRRHRAGPSCGPQSKCALRNSLEVVQLLLPHVLSFHSPACSGVGAVISILHMGKLRLVASPGSHSESLMGLGLAASFPSTGAMTAKGRGSKPRVQWVGGHLGAPHRLGFTGLGLSAASGAWWTEGVALERGAAGRGSLLLETSLLFPGLLPLTVMALEFQMTLVFCKEVSGLCERQPQIEPSQSSAPSLPSI